MKIPTPLRRDQLSLTGASAELSLWRDHKLGRSYAYSPKLKQWYLLTVHHYNALVQIGLIEGQPLSVPAMGAETE